MTVTPQPKQSEGKFYLTDLIKKSVKLNGKKIGRLSDLIAKGNGASPIVTAINYWFLDGVLQYLVLS